MTATRYDVKVPNAPKTPLLAVRVDQWVQDALALFAEGHDTTKSDVIRHALTEAIESERLPHHSCQHELYRLGCDDFDALLERSGGACEVCATVPPKLVIDHDHAIGWHAPRGLVCHSCNSRLRFVDSGTRKADEGIAAYLANPWHATRPPKQPRTMKKNRVFRCDDERWDAAKAVAEANGERMTDVLTRILTLFISGALDEPLGLRRDVPARTRVEDKT